MSEFRNENFNTEFEADVQNKRVVSVSDWMITILIMVLPVINIVMLFIWALSSSTPKSKSNWAKATLIWMAIGIGLMIVFWGAFAGLFLTEML